MLVQKVRTVESVTLFGDKAGIADEAAEVFFTGVVVGSGLRDDVFFDHDAAHVIAAKAEAHLADLQTGGDPTGLDVGDVV